MQHGQKVSTSHAAQAPVSLGPDLGASTLVTLTNAHGMEVRFIGRGGIILSIVVPDRNGVFANVALGFDDLSLYANDRFYFGALIGRNANRIANGEFMLDGKQHTLTRNDGRNHLHGGTAGFSSREWIVELIERDNEVGASLSIVSSDGDQGYPGTVSANVSYLLTDSNEFVVRYRATVDAPTPIDLTQHTYFNLSGKIDADILDHELEVRANFITPIDAASIPTGELRAVSDTPFDFRTCRRIRDRIADSDEQLRLAGGYDHNYVLDRSTPHPTVNNPSPTRGSSDDALKFAAWLRDPRSGRTLEIFTTEPAMQIYTGNELEQANGGAYLRFGGIALETQHYPNTPNQPSFPSSIIRPGQEYRSETVYRFSVDAPPGGRL